MPDTKAFTGQQQRHDICRTHTLFTVLHFSSPRTRLVPGSGQRLWLTRLRVMSKFLVIHRKTPLLGFTPDRNLKIIFYNFAVKQRCLLISKVKVYHYLLLTYAGNMFCLMLDTVIPARIEVSILKTATTIQSLCAPFLQCSVLQLTLNLNLHFTLRHETPVPLDARYMSCLLQVHFHKSCVTEKDTVSQ